MDVSDAVLAAIIGAAVGGIVSLISTRMSNKAAERRMNTDLERWYAEHFISRKVETLSNLYSSLVTSKIELSEPFSPDDSKVHMRKWDVIQAFELDLTQALVYLEGEEREVLRRYIREFDRVRFHYLDVSAAFSKDEKPPPFDRGKFNTAYKDAMTLMEKILNPELVKGIEPEE